MRMQIPHPHHKHSKTIHYILCLGFLVLLTGMFWLPERPDYHRAFYITLALPTFIALVMAPRRIPLLFSNGIFLIFLRTVNFNSYYSRLIKLLFIFFKYFLQKMLITHNFFLSRTIIFPLHIL